ncbi:MAG TPA: DUF2505 domain-containing protein [Candidatus Nanopelagicales bacterium]
MPTPLSASLNFPADPATTYALVTDSGYVHAVAEATGGERIDVSVEDTAEGGAVVTSRRELPAQVPSYAKALVGDRLRLVEVRTYGPAAEDGARTGEVKVNFDGVPVTIQGVLTLGAQGDGSVITLEASVRASIPFVGGKIERFAADEVIRFLHKETEVAQDRLGH